MITGTVTLGNLSITFTIVGNDADITTYNSVTGVVRKMSMNALEFMDTLRKAMEGTIAGTGEWL